MDYTREQILSHVLALDPPRALSLKNGNRLSAVRTQVYESVLIDGKVTRLKRNGGKYIACYIRVSSAIQKEDGFSAPEQTEALIDRCISEGKAFAVFSDVGLSGGLPYEDDALIQHFRESKAKMYEGVFRAVFLARPDQETERDLQGMEAYLLKNLKIIRNGGYEELFDLLPGEDLPKKGYNRKPKWFRPGLTALVQTLDNLSDIYVTDLSRLTRSELLMADLIPRFRERGIHVTGIYQDLTWLNADDLGAKILATVYTHMAEKTRWDQLLGNLRGVKQRLGSGIYNSKAPDWIIRQGDEGGRRSDNVGKSTNKNQKAALHPERAALARRIVEMYLEDDATTISVMHTLAQEGARNRFGGRWDNRQVGRLLDNPALLGYHSVYGKWWPVFPALIDEETWARIREKRSSRAADYKRRKESGVPVDRLMVGLLRCWCGYNLVSDGRPAKGLYYFCRNPAGHKGHGRLSQPKVDEFFDQLMRHYSEQVIDVVANHSDGATLMQELRDLEERSLQAAAERAQERERRKHELEPKVAELVEEGDPAFEDMLTRLLAARTRDLDEAERDDQERISAVRERIKEIRHEEDFAKMKTVTKTWADLSVQRRNQVLKDVFARIEYKRSETGEEWLEPIFKVPYTPCVVPIRLTLRRYGPSYMRVLPTPFEWGIELFYTAKFTRNQGRGDGEA